MYVEIPENLTERTVILEFGADAYRFYQNRIEERKRNGKIYCNPMKTIYIWAAQEKKSVFRLLIAMFLYVLLQAVDIITGILWIALTIVIAPFAILSDLLR